MWVTEWAARPGGVKEKTFTAMDTPNMVRFQGRIGLPDGGSYLDGRRAIPDGRVRRDLPPQGVRCCIELPGDFRMLL